MNIFERTSDVEDLGPGNMGLGAFMAIARQVVGPERRVTVQSDIRTMTVRVTLLGNVAQDELARVRRDLGERMPVLLGLEVVVGDLLMKLADDVREKREGAEPILFDALLEAGLVEGADTMDAEGRVQAAQTWASWAHGAPVPGAQIGPRGMVAGVSQKVLACLA